MFLDDSRHGWLYLPAAVEREDEVNFAAGAIRLERGDYLGAATLLDEVLNSKARTSTLVDALLLKAVALEMSGKDGQLTLESARKMNPSLRTVFQVKVMIDLQHILRTKENSEKKSLAIDAKNTLSSASILFDPNDPWFESASAAVDNCLTSLGDTVTP